MRTYIYNFLSALVLLALIAPAGVAFATIYSAGSLLQTGDVKTEHVLNGTLLDADVSAAALIGGTKVAPRGVQGALIMSNGTTLATSTALVFATSTSKLYIFGGSVEATSTNLNGVAYSWPSSQGSSNTVLVNDGAGSLSWANNSSNKLTANFTAGETISAGQAVAVASSTAATSAFNGTTAASSGNNTTTWQAQRFTTPATGAGRVTGITLNLTANGATFSGTVRISLYSDGGSSPGTELASSSPVSVNCSSGADCATLGTLDNGTATVSDSTNYYAVVRCLTNCTTPWDLIMQVWRANSAGQNTMQTTNSGSSWSNINGMLKGSVSYSGVTSGAVYLASASSQTFRYFGFVGLAENSASAGQSVTVDLAGLSTATSTTATSTTYYLGNTNGTLSTTAGTNSLKVGTGLSNLGILLRPATP